MLGRRRGGVPICRRWRGRLTCRGKSGEPTSQAGAEAAEGRVLSERGDGAGRGRAGGTMRSVLGVDVGGTFTDFVVYDPRTRQVEVWKELSTPGDPVTGILRGLA